MRSRVPDPDQVKPDTPLRLDVAAALAFPDGSMTGSGLRKEAGRGRLVVERVAGKDYTTLADIERMRALCRVPRKEFASGCVPASEMKTARSAGERSGSSETDRARSARAALQKIARTPSERSVSTSPVSTAPTEPAAVIPLRGRPARVVTAAAARRELEDLRAAINYHRREGLCSEIISVMLPSKPDSREKWLTRPEAARLLWAAWRAKQVLRDQQTRRAVSQHIARFILIGLYTGSRSAAICGAALMPTVGKGHVDLEHGVFYRRAIGRRQTKKRQPPVKLPPRLLAHMRRWKRLRLSKNAVVEWNGQPIKSVRKGFAAAARTAGLSDVTPHILRHTCATWLMQKGVNLWDAAGFLGMTVQQLEQGYGHHHPDYQEAAVAALGGLNGSRNSVNKERQASANVTKIADYSKAG
jgi:integrase